MAILFVVKGFVLIGLYKVGASTTNNSGTNGIRVFLSAGRENGRRQCKEGMTSGGEVKREGERGKEYEERMDEVRSVVCWRCCNRFCFSRVFDEVGSKTRTKKTKSVLFWNKREKEG